MDSWTLDRIERAISRRLPTPARRVVKMRGGYRLALLPRSDPHERVLYQNRTYEPATLDLFDAVLRPGDYMIDVGANLGVMSLYAASLVGSLGRVLALEPHPGMFRRLCEHISMNKATNITCLQAAAGAATGDLPLYDVPTVSIGRASLLVPDEPHSPVGLVPVSRLDDLAEEHRITKPRLLKIDVEGFEPEVLRGATQVLSAEPVVCRECSPSVPSSAGDPLAAHRMILSTGRYACFRFKNSKFASPSPLVPVRDDSDLAGMENENTVYMPLRVREELPDRLFAM